MDWPGLAQWWLIDNSNWIPYAVGALALVAWRLRSAVSLDTK